MRFEEQGHRRWVLTWAFPLTAAAAAREGYAGGILEGEIETSDEFPGCPHCGDMNFVLCGNCERVTCNAAGATWFRCAWCESEGSIEGTIGRLKTAGDR